METFAYAEAWDEGRRRYLGLRAGQAGTVVMDSRSVIVKPVCVNRKLSHRDGRILSHPGLEYLGFIDLKR